MARAARASCVGRLKREVTMSAGPDGGDEGAGGRRSSERPTGVWNILVLVF